MKLVKLIIIIFVCQIHVFAQTGQVKVGILRYDGGGDWYANKTAVPNLIKSSNEVLKTNISSEPVYVRADEEIFDYPFVHMTGHGNVVFSDKERRVLRTYLLNGGFLHIDDNYGMDKYVRDEILNIFPEFRLQKIPFSHSIFHQKYDFDNGVPKVHLHDGGDPMAYAIVVEGRIVLLYTNESDLGNGWEDKDVYFDDDKVRKRAMEMGVNIISYVFTSSFKEIVLVTK
jgi:hypothetical protein